MTSEMKGRAARKEAIRDVMREQPEKHAEAVRRAMVEQRATFDESKLHARLTRDILDHQAKYGDPRAINHTVQVTSVCGCGSTALYGHLAAADVDVPKTPGHFLFRHLRNPPAPEEVPPGFRVVYLFGDPRNALMSIFRRGLQESAYRWLHFREDGDILEWLKERPPEEARQRLSSLEAFLEAGVDEFQLEDHLERWLTRQRSGYQVLFIRFESLPDTWPAVRDFVGLDPHHPAVELRRRGSDWETLPPALREQINEVYGGLVERIEALPAVQIL
jgi:hypothetical protein